MTKIWVAVGLCAVFLISCVSPEVTVAPKVMETSRDGRFIAYDNGTVKDASTGLMWAAEDNGVPITWEEAINFCRDYKVGGYNDWRMPTQNELAALYNPEIVNRGTHDEGCKGGYHITDLIHITCCCIWYWNGVDEVGGFFHFDTGPAGWRDQDPSLHPRALPVRGPENGPGFQLSSAHL